MNSKDKRESNMTLVDAVQTLSNIADLDIGKEVGATQSHDLFIQNRKITYKTVHWLDRQEADKTVVLVKETFRVILDYLRNFYEKDYSYITNPQAIERIKAIMVLVGEAAKKLDKYTALVDNQHKKSVTQLREYKKLQEFYQRRIARKIDEGVLGKWILALSKQAIARNRHLKATDKHPLETKHIFVDLESVKKDTEYELFFLRKEDGSRFFSPRLIRNIKLVCDFGDFFGGGRQRDPLEDIKLWQDSVFHSSAKGVLRACGTAIDTYFHEAAKYKDKELVSNLNKAMMSLMLAAQSRNHLQHMPAKSCGEYFKDYLGFLKDSLRSDEYKRLITYPPRKPGKLTHVLLKTVHALCRALFVSLQSYEQFHPILDGLINEASRTASNEHIEAAEAASSCWNKIAGDYSTLSKLFKKHASGPLIKMLEALQTGDCQTYDPLSQANLPNQLFAIGLEDKKYLNLLIPSPTAQELIHKAWVGDEFKAFLRSCSRDIYIKKHLMINLQDRTSWREHARCIALEDLQNHHDFEKFFTVATLAKDTEFYHQLAPYHQDNHAETFFKHFKEHLGDENSGYFFPVQVKKALNDHFIDGVIAAIHRVFFSGKNILLREHRLDFIEIFDMFLVLKIIETVKPDSFSLTCKDGVDTACTANSLLLTFFLMMNNEKISGADCRHIENVLFTPSIIVRERMVHPDRFNRMISAMKTIEFVYKELGQNMFSMLINEAFALYYKTDILKAIPILPT